MVIADSDLFIASIRGNEIAEALLRKHGNSLAVSAITAMELYVGATNQSKKLIVDEILKEHEVLFLTKGISEIAIRLLKEHNRQSRKLLMPDALIAATCLEHKAALLTFNTKDFNFIKGLKLVK